MEKVKMAALDDSLTKFEGKLWPLWAENVGISKHLCKCECVRVSFTNSCQNWLNMLYGIVNKNSCFTREFFRCDLTNTLINELFYSTDRQNTEDNVKSRRQSSSSFLGKDGKPWSYHRFPSIINNTFVINVYIHAGGSGMPAETEWELVFQ